MGSFDYNDDYSSFDNLLERCKVFTEGGKGLGGYYSGFGKGLTGKLRDVGSTAVPRDSRKFVVHVLYTQLEPKIITDEELTELESSGPEAGSRYNLTLQKILDIHKDEITKRADEIGQIIEDRFPALANEILGRGPQRIQGVLVQAAISKVLTNIQTSLGEPGLDIEEEALQEVVDYAERIQTVDQLSDFVRQIAKEPGYQKIALYLSAVVKPLRGNKPEEDFEDDESAPYRSMYEPGDSGNAYAEGESEAQSTEVEDEEDREKPGGSNAGDYPNVDKSDFCGPAGGAPEGTYPVNSEKRARAALSYAHNAPDPEGLKRCVYRKAKEHGWFDEEDEEFKYSPMLDSHQTNTSGYITEQAAKDKRNKKSKVKNESFKERFKPKTHWQLQELRRRGL